MSPEDFKPVFGFEDRYEVNCLGEIRNRKTKKVLKQGVCKDGYIVVPLFDGQRSRVMRVHTLVGRTFLRPLAPGELFKHKNQDKTDNWVGNLAIATFKEVYSEIGRRGQRRRSVVLLDDDGNVVDSFPSAKVASKELFLSLTQVMVRLNNKMKTRKPPFIRWAKAEEA